MHLDQVNQTLTVRLHAGKEQVGQWLVDEEEVVITVREQDRPGVRLRASLQA